MRNTLIFLLLHHSAHSTFVAAVLCSAGEGGINAGVGDIGFGHGHSYGCGGHIAGCSRLRVGRRGSGRSVVGAGAGAKRVGNDSACKNNCNLFHKLPPENLISVCSISFISTLRLEMCVSSYVFLK